MFHTSQTDMATGNAGDLSADAHRRALLTTVAIENGDIATTDQGQVNDARVDEGEGAIRVDAAST